MILIIASKKFLAAFGATKYSLSFKVAFIGVSYRLHECLALFAGNFHISYHLAVNLWSDSLLIRTTRQIMLSITGTPSVRGVSALGEAGCFIGITINPSS